jgi:hypothetical protein
MIWENGVATFVQPAKPLPRTRVVNVRYEPHFDVFIGRRATAKRAIGVLEIEGHDGYFGNDVGAGITLTREESINAFREYFTKRIAEDPEFKRRVEALRGKVLACWCAPAACHGNVYVDYLEGELRK